MSTRGRQPWLLLAIGLLVAALVLQTVVVFGDDDSTARPSTTASSELRAGGATLLPATAGLGARTGQRVVGKDVAVLAATRAGFLVGTSELDAIYVEYGAVTGKNERGAFRPEVGQRVDLSGVVRPAPPDAAAALHLTAKQARSVVERRGFINASSVTVGG